ncbi:hypothetical protein THAOC_05155, partial [Thalassiosira oceanica]
TNYDTNKTHLDEAPFGRADDDNGPGSEPPPHDRKRYVSTFMLSRRRPPAAVGKPSFPRFKVDCLPHDVLRPDEPTDLREGDLPDATSYERSEDIGPKRRKQRIGAVYPASVFGAKLTDISPPLALGRNRVEFYPLAKIDDKRKGSTLAVYHGDPMTISSDVAPKTLSRGPIEMVYANIQPNLESGWLFTACKLKG